MCVEWLEFMEVLFDMKFFIGFFCWSEIDLSCGWFGGKNNDNRYDLGFFYILCV